MTNWIDLTNFAFAVAGLMISVLGFLMSLRSRMKDPVTRQFFIAFFLIIIIYTASGLLDQCSLVLFGPEYQILSQAALFSESMFSSVLLPLLTLFILHSCAESWRSHPLLYISAGLWILYMILLILTQFIPVFYYIDEQNAYHRGSGYPILLLPVAFLMLTNIIAVIRRRKKLNKTQRNAFLIYLLVPLLCMLIQMFSYGLLLIIIGTSVSALIMYLHILQEQQEQLLRQEQENARKEVSIKVLQMRPHFIYNTMSSIYYLCDLDPEKAKQVIADFTMYLRKNYSAIVKEKLIPFEEELEHTKAYLAVEKARYERCLFVEYDTLFTQFRLPPLTLQPIAENAVKHGLDPELEPLHLRIHTECQDDTAIVTVEDSGPGFDPRDWDMDQDNNETSHIGLANVRDRLKLMADASLDISSGETGGSIITIRIPL